MSHDFVTYDELKGPDLAQAVFVTRKRIETHLGHVYRKLDISDRGKLVHALAEAAPKR